MKYLSVFEISKLIGYSRMTIWLWIRFGELKGMKVGNRWIVSQKAFLQFLENTDKVNINEKMRIKAELKGR